jgi:hypothetical protein
MKKLSERRAGRRAQTITPAQAERVMTNLRLLLTFIDTNIPAEITEPNREGRMGMARSALHEKPTDYGWAAFMLLTLMDFVEVNYRGDADVLYDAVLVLAELGLMELKLEPIEGGQL